MCNGHNGKIRYITSLSCATDSMYPWFKCGDLLYAETVRGVELEVGKVYCYSPDRSWWRTNYWYICHRLIQYDGENCSFVGDNNNFLDPIVNKKYVSLHLYKMG